MNEEVIKITKANKKSSRRAEKKKDKFPHFRKYFKSNHPALILDEEGDDYRFRRVTSSEFSGHHKNEEISPNPDKTRKTPMYIVKNQQKDKKKRFSTWKYPWKYPKKKK